MVCLFTKKNRFYLSVITVVGLGVGLSAHGSLGSLGDYIREFVQSIENRALERDKISSAIAEQCDLLKSRITSYNDQLDQRGKDCASVGTQIGDAQVIFKNLLDDRQKARLDVEKYFPIANRTDWEITNQAKQSTKSLSDEMTSLRASLETQLIQKSMLTSQYKASSINLSWILNQCVFSIVFFIPGSDREKAIDACKNHNFVYQKALNEVTKVKIDLDRISNSVAALECRIDSLRLTLTAEVPKRISELFKEREDAFKIVTATMVSLRKMDASIIKVAGELTELKRKLWELNEGYSQVCKSVGAKTVPKACTEQRG